MKFGKKLLASLALGLFILSSGCSGGPSATEIDKSKNVKVETKEDAKDESPVPKMKESSKPL